MHNLLSRNRLIKIYLSLSTELYETVLESKKGMVFTHANIFTWKHVCTSLSYDNLTSKHG